VENLQQQASQHE